MKLAIAHNFFTKNKFEKALEALKMFDGYPAFYQLRYRSLQLVCLLDFVPHNYANEDFFDSLRRSFSTYLDRNVEIIPQRIGHYRTFLHYINCVKKYLTQSNGAISKDALKKEIEEKNMVFKDWLLEKIEQKK